MFLTETASLADVVLPAANAYEKSGTFTNTCGDLQMLKKAARPGRYKSDFEIIVRIADAMGYDVKQPGALRPPHARRHGPVAGRAVGRSGSPRGMAGSPRPGAKHVALRSRGDAGRNSATGARLRRFAPQPAGGQRGAYGVPARAAGSLPSHPELIVPSERHAVYFRNAGRYSSTLKSVMEARRPEPADKEVEV